MNSEKEEVKLLNYQIIATILYIGSLGLSLLITFNDKLEEQGKGKIIEDKTYRNLTIFNRTLVLGLTLVYLYISYRNLSMAKEKKIDTNPFNLQAMASELSVIGAIIVLYVVITSENNIYSIIAGAENPVL